MGPGFPGTEPAEDHDGAPAGRFALTRSRRGVGLAEDVEGFADVGLGDRERRRDAEDIALEAAFSDQEPALLRLLEDAVAERLVGRAVTRSLVGDVLDAEHQAF